jgi:hypothetical protein
MSAASTRRSAIGIAALATPIAAPALVSLNPDAELIRICRGFAENELEKFYRYVTTEDTDDLDDEPVDWDTYRRILATPATTPEGWHAKALAFTSWDREAYDDHEDYRDPSTTFLASLLRDAVAPARNAIVARCAAKYGPLPPSSLSELTRIEGGR